MQYFQTLLFLECIHGCFILFLLLFCAYSYTTNGIKYYHCPSQLGIYLFYLYVEMFNIHIHVYTQKPYIHVSLIISQGFQPWTFAALGNGSRHFSDTSTLA